MFFTCLFLLFWNIPFALSSCSHGTYLNPSAELPDYDYLTIDGPVNWHNIKPAYRDCGIGRYQSPINLSPLPGDNTVEMTVPEHNALFKNLKTTVEVDIEGTTIALSDREWELKQFHFHTPSEHRINGEHFPVEMHMVHESKLLPPGLLVVTLLFQLSCESSTEVIDEVISYIGKIPKPGDETVIPNLNLSPLTSEINEMKFVSYLGSLTTPPCAEGVNFLIGSPRLPLNVTTYNRLKEVVGFNSRFLQLNPGVNILCISARGIGCDGKKGDRAPPFQQPVMEL